MVRWKNAYFLLFLACKSRNSGDSGRNSPRQTDFFGENRDFGQENLASWREKYPEKGGFCPQSGRNGRKRAVLGWEITGRGWSENMDLTADFAMLWSSKIGANEFFSHFFSSKSCRECRNALPLHSQSGSNALARESYALNATRQQKCCCDLWKSYITDCREVQGTIDHEAFFLSGKKLLRVKWIVPSNSTPKQNKGYRNLSDKNRKQTNIIFTMKSLILAQDER